MTLRISSPAFGPGARIPAHHTGEGDDVSPALSWGPAPAGTKEICLVCEDPDAPRPQPWVHWLVAGIPATREGLAEGESDGLVPGRNDFGEDGWGGPMPPRGHGPHRYIFTVYALKRPTGVHQGFSRDDLFRAMDGHVLAQDQLIGIYERA